MAKPSPVKTFELFFTPRFPLFFIFGALALAVLGNVFTDLVKLYIGSEARQLWLIFGVAAGLLVLVVVLAYGVGAIRARLATADGLAVINQPRPQQYRGLIAYVSLAQRAHLEKALQYHGEALERVWLLATKDAQELAKELQAEYASPKRIVQIIALSNEWDLQAARAVVEQIYQEQLGALKEEDVIADFTGGTKPMTVGMIFACLSPARHLEYVPARYGTGEPEPLEPVEYFLGAAPTASLAESAQPTPANERVLVKRH
jgi:hypothetical protein